MSTKTVAESGQTQKGAPPGNTDQSNQGVIFTPAASIHAEPVQWAWRDRVPLGALTLLVGVIISLFTAITITRTFLRAVVRTRLARSRWAFDLDQTSATTGTTVTTPVTEA